MKRILVLLSTLACFSAFGGNVHSVTIDFYSVTNAIDQEQVARARHLLAQEVAQGEIAKLHETKSPTNGSISLCIEAKTEESLLRIQSLLKSQVAAQPGSQAYPYPLCSAHPHSCDVERSQREAPYTSGGCYR